MIVFEECQSPGYKARTLRNACADVTIAIAVDFSTAGERCTKNCIPRTSLYYPIDYHKMPVLVLASSYVLTKKAPFISLNIAGNGIYSLPHTQEEVDEKVYDFLKRLFRLVPLPKVIKSGGQTGIDEAGLKAAVLLDIPAYCLAPKGWVFRDKNHRDIADEKLFKARFE
jgi:hypothetical protein